MRNALIAALLVSAGSSLAAQAPAAVTPRVGIVGGINLASLSDAGGTSNRTGFVGGVMLSLPVSGNFAFQPEVEYSMKGAASNSSDASAAAKINYVEVPLLLRLDIPASGGVKPFVLAGPTVALKVSCDVEAESGGTSVSFSCDELARELGSPGSTVSFASTDVGVAVGGGLAFDVGGRALTLGVRYEMGFVSISSQSDSKNRVLSFVGTFEWPFHK
jgi:hypothetical protein